MVKRHPTLIPLSHDHHHALALALQCRKHALGQVHPGNPKALSVHTDKVKAFFHKSLRLHFEAEEKVLFPLMVSESRDAEPLVAQLVREHEQMLKDVTALEGESQLPETLFNLGDLLERHIRSEERELFPLFERTVPATKAEKARQEIAEILAPEPNRRS